MHIRSKHGDGLAVETWRLDGKDRSAVFASFDGDLPALIHFGTAIPAFEDLETLARAGLPNTAGGQLDPIVPLTLFPSAMQGWQGHPGYNGRGAFAMSLKAVENSNNRLHFIIDVEGRSIDVHAYLCPQTGLLNIQATPHFADAAWLGVSIPVADSMGRILDHSGRWTGEFQNQEKRFQTGQYVRESQEGRAGHAHFPGMIFAADNCDENNGQCLGVALAWSGGHKFIAEEIPDGRRHVQVGFCDSTVHYPRDLWIGFSDCGFNGLSQAMTAHVRASLPKKVERPVHYNCWEAVYFRHSVDELKVIATLAADLGAERFVLDDGWFKGRNDDTTSLGDWTVDHEKYPDGLHPLVDHIIGLGLQFGIWFEPEMVNTDSDLYRAHPDWVLGPNGQPSGRGQFVLDLTKPAVTDYLFDAIAGFLSEYPANYIKWDHNRILTGGDATQTVALYMLLDRLNAAFPHVEIETCASGGGRLDYGMLNHTTRVWLSDSNDALERSRMQYEASRWLPPQVQGSHVGPRICHTSGRIIPMQMRAWVAAQRHMGFEMDPRELTDDEAQQLKSTTKWYKQNRDFLFGADHYRLDSADADVVGEMFVSSDQARFTLFNGKLGASRQVASRTLNLAGLEPEARYQLHLLTPEVVVRVLNQNTALPLAKGEPIIMTGQALMSGALRLPNTFAQTMMVIEGKRVES